MRELAVVGMVAILFGLGATTATGSLGTFGAVNLVAGGTALLVALGAALRRAGAPAGPDARRVAARGLLLIAGSLAAGVGLERAAARSGVRLDWTLEESFEISPALLRRLDEAFTRTGEPVEALLFSDPGDPRVRRTRLLLEAIARDSGGQLVARERGLEQHLDAADRYEVGSSNSVVLRAGERFETVPRPTEGSLFEALHRLEHRGTGTVVILRGEGEGDPERSDGLGYSGLATALGLEGYAVRSRVSAALAEVPADVDVVLVIAPERRLLPQTLAALRAHLERGGALVALLEPGRESGVEELLAEYGIEPLEALVVDPASGPPLGGGAEGIDVIAFNFETLPVTRGLDANRMVFLPGVRPLRLRRPRPDDEVRRAVLSSPQAWATRDLGWLRRRAGRPENAGEPTGYQTLAAVARYPRAGRDPRIVVFGDAEFASNRWLRTLYNLDLAMNAVHWAAQNEVEITLRPKVRSAVQFPLPVVDSLSALRGVGLVVPELLLIVGAIVWLRRRSA